MSDKKPREFWYYNNHLSNNEPDLAYRGECIHLIEVTPKTLAVEEMFEAIEYLMEMGGKRDFTNPKYDAFFITMKALYLKIKGES